MAMYIEWDYSTSSVIGAPSNEPLDNGGTWLECYLPAIPRSSPNQILVWQLLEGTHANYLHGSWSGSHDPMDIAATREKINETHRELEISPVSVFGEPFDCDERSEVRMRDAIAFWDSRPLEAGVFEEREINGEIQKVIIWTKGDNTLVDLTREQLQAIFYEMLAQRALRGAILFASLRRFKDNPNTTLRDINDPANWGI